MAEAMTTLGGGETPEEEPEETPADTSGGGKKSGGFRQGFSDAFQNARKKTGGAAKEGAKKVGQETGKKLAEKGAQSAVSKGIGGALGTAVGGPLGTVLGAAVGHLAGKLLFNRNVHYAIIALLLIILLMIWAPAGGVVLSYMHGGLTGGSSKIETDPSSPAHKKTIDTLVGYTQGAGGACGKRLEFADAKDFDLVKQGKVDYRVLLAIKTLAAENQHIKIGQVMNLMSQVPANTIETHSTLQKRYLDNISAHKAGMAFDILEINCVYKYCTCSDKCGCSQIPVQVAWQEKNALGGLGLATGLNRIEELLGLPKGALSGANPDQIFQNSGWATLERIFGVNPGTFSSTTDLQSLIDKYGRAEIERTLGLPPGSLNNQKALGETTSNTGRRQLEAVLGLPEGSLNGASPDQLYYNTGKKSVTEELNVPDDWLRVDFRKARSHLVSLKLSAADQRSIETSVGWPRGTIASLITALGRSDGARVKNILEDAGKGALEKRLGLPTGELDIGGAAPISLDQSRKQDQANGLPDGTLKSFIEDLKNGRNPTTNMIKVGAPLLDRGLTLPEGTVEDIIYGRITPEEALRKSQAYGFEDWFTAQNPESSRDEATGIKSDILKGRSVSPRATKLGSSKIEKYFGLVPGSLSGVISGQITSDAFLSQNRSAIDQAAQGLGLPPEAMEMIFSNNTSGGAQEIGKAQLSSVFGFDPDKLESWVKSGNMEALIQNKVIEAIASSLGINPGIIAGIFTGNIDTQALISLGMQILLGGPLGGIFGSVLGGQCTTACYASKAQQNVRKAISQLLDMGKDDDNLKPIQLITYKQSDVDNFSSLVDQLYGANRQPNYGLFARDEMRGHIHVGY